MMFEEVKWLRAYSYKTCNTLRKAVIDTYRPAKGFPCFVQRLIRYFKQHWHKMPVIVQIKEDIKTASSMSLVAQKTGCKILRELPIINGFSTKVTTAKLQSLLEDKSVKKVWYDRQVKALLDVASKTVKADMLWNRNYTGKGIGVAVLDTGVYDHPDLSGRISAFKDFIKNALSPYDDNGHGTHVAGDIAASGQSSDSKFQGPAKDCNIIGVKVLDKMGSGSLSTVIQGIQWCIDNKDKYNIRVINLSLGSDATESYKNDPVCQAVELAWQSGIIVCAAAGNSGPGSKTINSPGIDPTIITVGALDDKNTETLEDDSVAEFSSRGPTIDNITKPDIIAPGANIVSLRSPRSFLDKTLKNTRYDNLHTTLSGTSMATPICAGVIAQILEADSSLTPDEVKLRLISTATKLPNIDEYAQGAGLINGELALDYIKQVGHKEVKGEVSI